MYRLFFQYDNGERYFNVEYYTFVNENGKQYVIFKDRRGEDHKVDTTFLAKAENLTGGRK